MKKHLLYFLLLVWIGFSCSDDGPEEPIAEPPQFLEEWESIQAYSSNLVRNLAALSGYSSLANTLEYDVVVYRITYRTDYLGQTVLASGLVGLPSTTEEVPMLSFQHGTIASDNKAPTNDLNTYGPLAGLASGGYIFLIPDFLGFGESADLLHPYYHADLTASSIIDMLRAVEELAEEENVNFDGNVFLAGYSEGGYATMATHRELQENPVEGLQLVASTCGAGGYDVKLMQEYLFGLETYGDPFYLAYITMSYRSVYEWDDPLTNFFQEPYAGLIPGLFDGTNTGSQINNALTPVVADFINPDFLANVDQDPQYQDFVDALEENSLTDWVPTIPISLYHGDADETVPWSNSLATVEQFLRNGANTEVLEFFTIEGAGHGTGSVPYLLDTWDKFSALK